VSLNNVDLKQTGEPIPSVPVVQLLRVGITFAESRPHYRWSSRLLEHCPRAWVAAHWQWFPLRIRLIC